MKIRSKLKLCFLVFILLGLAIVPVNARGQNLDYKNLPDGKYSVDLEVRLYSDNPNTPISLSMMDDAVEKPAKITVENGHYYLQFKMIPKVLDDGEDVFEGYLGNLKYYDSFNNLKEVTVLDYYDIKDEYTNKYNFSYPKNIKYPIEKPTNTVQETKVQVFVPIMESFGEGQGTKKAKPTIKWETLKPIDNRDFVQLGAVDKLNSHIDIAMAMDQVGEIVNRDGNKYLKINFFSKQMDSRGYDYGTPTLKYSYNNGSKYNCTLSEVERGFINGQYIISSTEIPLYENRELKLYGEFAQTTNLNNRIERSATVSIMQNIDVDTNTFHNPKLLMVTQGAFSIKRTGEQLPFDIKKGSRIYTPYSSDNGTKFNLTESGEMVRLILQRESFQADSLREIRYTMDGSEPNKSSPMADLGYANISLMKPQKCYKIYLDPLAEGVIGTNGGDITVKLKAYSKDGLHSQTKSIIIPYGKVHKDRIATSSMFDGTITTEINTKNRYALPDNGRIKFYNLSDDSMQQNMKDLANNMGITTSAIFKMEFMDGYNPMVLNYVGNWNADLNPLVEMKLDGFKYDDYHLFIYKNGQLKLLSARMKPSSVGNLMTVGINDREGYYLLGYGNGDNLKSIIRNQISSKIEEAENIIEQVGSTYYGTILKSEVASAKRILNNPKIKLYSLNKNLQNLEKYIEKALDYTEIPNSFYVEKAQRLMSIGRNQTYRSLLDNYSISDLDTAIESAEKALNSNDIRALKNAVSNLENALENAKYNYPTKNIGIQIKKANSDQLSMANNVFEQRAKLIEKDSKKYLELGLKTMIFGDIRAHLLDLYVFKNQLDGEIFNIVPVSLYEDAFGGEVELYNKKILIEVDGAIRDEYKIRLKNDAMGDATPQARLVIN